MSLGDGIAIRLVRAGRRARYESMLSLYEENYRLFLRLFPDLAERRAPGPLMLDPVPGARIELTGGGRYTSFLRLSHDLDQGGRRVPDLRLEIRLYHDARLAEVVSYQGHGRFLALYPMPNRQMYQAHEKQQVNGFLHEWLRHCLARTARSRLEGPASA